MYFLLKHGDIPASYASLPNLKAICGIYCYTEAADQTHFDRIYGGIPDIFENIKPIWMPIYDV